VGYTACRGARNPSAVLPSSGATRPHKLLQVHLSRASGLVVATGGADRPCQVVVVVAKRLPNTTPSRGRPTATGEADRPRRVAGKQLPTTTPWSDSSTGTGGVGRPLVVYRSNQSLPNQGIAVCLVSVKARPQLYHQQCR
jgi:hypothetical protein